MIAVDCHSLLSLLLTLQACVADPSAAREAFNPYDGLGPAYPLLLSSLQEGHLEAAQLLLLVQLAHQHHQLHQQLQSKAGLCDHAQPAALAGTALPANNSDSSTAMVDASTTAGVLDPVGPADIAAKSTASANDTRNIATEGAAISQQAVLWPEWVLSRLARLATSPPPSSSPLLPVVSIRLLATAAAAAAAAVDAAPATSRTRARHPTRLAAVLQPLHLAALATGSGTRAASASADGANSVDTTAAATAQSWLTTLGPVGVMALSHLATNCARLASPSSQCSTLAAKSLQPILAPSLVATAAEQQGEGSSSSTTYASAAAAIAGSSAAATDAEGLLYSSRDAACLLWKLISGMPHSQQQPLKGVSNSSTYGWSPATVATPVSSQALNSQYSNVSNGIPAAASIACSHNGGADCTVSEHLTHQLHLLVLDDGDAAVLCGASNDASKPQSGSCSNKIEASRCNLRQQNTALCCKAVFVAVANLTSLVLEDDSLATNAQSIRDTHEWLCGLIADSLRRTTQKLDWSGKPCGFELQSAAKSPCRAPATINRPARYHMASPSSLPSASTSAPVAARPSPGAATCNSAAAWTGRSQQIYRTWLQDMGFAYPNTLLEACLQLLLAGIQAGGKAAAAQLYRLDVSNTLERLCSFCGDEILLMVETVYGHMGLCNAQLRQEVIQDENSLGLSGIIQTCSRTTGVPAAAAAPAAGSGNAAAVSCSSCAAAKLITASASTISAGTRGSSSTSSALKLLQVQAEAMSRLAGAIDAASGREFLWAIGALPVRAHSTATTMTVKGGSSSSAATYASTAAEAGLARVLNSSRCAVAVAVSVLLGWQQHEWQQEQRPLLDSCKQVFLAALGRSRQMQQLTRLEVPKGGLWSKLGGNLVRQLETTALNPGLTYTVAGKAAPLLKHNSVAPHACASSCNINVPANTATRPAASTNSGSNRSSNGSKGGNSGSGQRRTSSKRRVGVAAPAGVAHSSLVTVAVDGSSNNSVYSEYDEDGLRVVWSSGPSAAEVAARETWKHLSLTELLSWTQSSMDLDVRLLLPAGTRKQDVVVSIKPDRLTVRLVWAGRILDGPLAKRIKPSEACWVLDKTTVNLSALLQKRHSHSSGAESAKSATSRDAGNSTGNGSHGAEVCASKAVAATAAAAAANSVAGGGDTEFVELMISLPKEDGGHFWRAMFEGGPEKSHLEVLHEAVTNEDDARLAPTVDELGPEAALLLEELRERQELMVSGQWDIERHFDDFRLVIGDATL
eukprot:GHRR01012684.1.p1 GENE.GHRR01012684.1~~GHRR01012684.1.p1  ORF type:complete len:1253 (+),score=503.45 GHRR01012684.1:202-3960(+)